MALELTGDHVLRLSMRIMGRCWTWGEADCCTAACDVFQALHGVDPMASLRGVYRTKIGAQRAIVARGGWMVMAETLAREAGLGAGQGAAGDIALVRTEAGLYALAVTLGEGACVAKSLNGGTILQGFERSWACPR